MELNIVYIGGLSFPLGYAMTKRRRYMVDYMNEKNIECHVLSTRYKKNEQLNNPSKGMYGKTDYYDLSDLFYKGCIFSYYGKGKQKIKQWYNSSKKNIMIFSTKLNVEDFIFFQYAYRLGYKIVFDQVETSYLADGTNESIKRKCYILFCEFISDYAYKKASGSFVISEALLRQNKSKYPNIPLCLLPNSTPILFGVSKTTIGSPVKILYSGTYALKDGVSFLIEGVKKAVQIGCKCELILVGKGRVRDMTFLDEIKDFSWIKYLGFISDEELYAKMRESDILAMTRINSKFANFGFPFKLSEYLSTGNVVMATEVGDVPLYLNKSNSLLIPPEDSNAIANAILYVSENPVNSLQIGRNGLNTMKEKFSIKRIGEIFISFLCEI